MRKLWIVAVAAGGLFASALLASCSSDTSTAPAQASKGPATCPATRESTINPAKPTRQGDLVPAEPTRALLCVYPFRSGDNSAALLSESHNIEQGKAHEVVAYLNSLPSEVPKGTDCLQIGRDLYTVVFEYQGLHATVPLGCGAEYAGAVRHEFDLRKILGFWNVSL